MFPDSRDVPHPGEVIGATVVATCPGGISKVTVRLSTSTVDNSKMQDFSKSWTALGRAQDSISVLNIAWNL